MRSLERVNIRTNVRTYVRTHIHTYGTDPISLHNFVVRGDNNIFEAVSFEDAVYSFDNGMFC